MSDFLKDAKAALEDTVQDVKDAIGLPTARSTKKRIDAATGINRTKAEQDRLAGIKRND